MRPRSIVFDVYGGHAGDPAAAISLGALVELLACFGISEEATRVTMSRLRREGWFVSRRVGRGSWYRPSEQGRAYLEEGRARMLERRPAEWSGQWCLIVRSPARAAREERDRLRQRLARLGFGRLDASTWLSPNHHAGRLAGRLGDDPAALGLDVFQARSGGLEHDRELAARCWDLARRNADYAGFARRHQRRLDRYESGRLTDRRCFVERTRLLEEYRRLLGNDPGLPAALLPDPWWGFRAHDVFLDARDLLGRPAQSFFEAVGGAATPGAG